MTSQSDHVEREVDSYDNNEEGRYGDGLLLDGCFLDSGKVPLPWLLGSHNMCIDPIDVHHEGDESKD